MFQPPLDRSGSVNTCPKCSQPFRTADSPHVPLILSCRHLCCEECIRSAFCTERQIICLQCGVTSKAKTSLDMKLSNLRDSFPLSEKMVEEINKLTQMKPVDESSIGFKTSKRRSNEKPSPNSSLHDGACDECHKLLATLKCVDCKGTLFCQKCWQRVHSFKATKDHEFQPLSTSSSLNLVEKKPEYAKQLKESREKLIRKQEKIESSLEILKKSDVIEEARTSGIDTQVGENLRQFFLYCQNTIKSLENQVIKEFESVALSLDKSRTKCIKELNHSQMEIIELMKDLYAVSGEEFVDCAVVEKLLAKARQLLEKPDSFHTKRPVKGSKIEMPSKQWISVLESELKFDFGTPGEFCLTKNIADFDQTNYCDSTPKPSMSLNFGDTGDAFEKASHSSLTFSDQSRNQFRQRRPSKTLSLQNDYSGAECRFRETLADTESAPRGCRSVRGMHPNVSQVSGPSLASCGMAGALRNHFDQKTSIVRANFGRQVRFKEGWRGPVHISCVSSPSYFYVQLEPGLATLEKYRKFFSKAGSGPAVDKKDIKIANMYLAQCSDGEWYRVRLRKIIPDEQSILVSLIDTGKNEMVDVSNLRRIDDIMKSVSMDPEIAIECCIFDCYPLVPNWRKEDCELFGKTLKDKHIIMHVQKVQTNKLEVDLEWTKGTTSVSIRDFLLMTGVACMANRKNNQSLITPPDTKYFKDRGFELKDTINVKVSYVYGPDEIYVKRHDKISEKMFEIMNAEIDTFYKNSFHYKTYAVATPIPGLPIAAQYTEDNTWYRAEIIAVNPQLKKVDVQYVDFGNKEPVSFGRIRMLAKEFYKFTIQTIRCSLAGIKPVIGTKYKGSNVDFLIKHFQNQLLEMVVEDIKGDELSVILYKNSENEKICINTLLVEERYARKAGDFLEKASVYPKRNATLDLTPKSVDVQELSVNPPKEDETGMSVKIESITSKETEAESNEVASDGDDEKSEDGSEVPFCEDMVENDDVVNDSSEKPRFEVKIASFVNPNLFYVTLIGQLGRIQRLIDDMLKFYSDEKNSTHLTIESIEKDTKCVAFSKNDEKWYRAKVLEVKENNQVEVFFKDVARGEVVKSENLRQLVQHFNTEVDGSVACHMVNIEERSEWPKCLCNSLITALDSYSSIYVTKYRTAKEDGKATYPVELWGKRVTCQGAFAPATEEWTNVNQLFMKTLQNDNLIELESGSNPEPLKEESVKTLDEACDINSTETVKKWLHNSMVESTKKRVEYSDIVANGEIPVEHLFSAKSSKSSVPNAEQNLPQDAPIREWKPAEPIELEEFQVWTTYVDDDFNLYAQNTGKQRKVLEMISNGLRHRFEGTTPLSTDLYWYPGQMCIAWFDLDKKWYRGKVLEVKDEKARIEYVDFGNVEWVYMIHLRKDIFLDHYPIQCYKLPIRSDCVPVSENGKWPTKILDFVHAEVLERKWLIKLRKEKGENFYRIEKLILEDTGVEFFDYLCQLGYANFVTASSSKHSKPGKSQRSGEMNDDDGDEHRSDASSAIAAIDSVSNVDPSEFLQVPGISTIILDPFSIPQNPQENEIVVPYFEVPVADLDLVTVEVIEILQSDEIVVHIVDCENEAVNYNRKRFLNMTSELQKKGADQPKLTSLSIGRMCCTKFDDNLWYRVKIIDYCTDGDSVNILYVDYGNSSRANPAELHVMKKSWFDIPMQTIRCRLMDYDGPTECDERNLEEMLKLLNHKYEAVIDADEEEHRYKIRLFFK